MSTREDYLFAIIGYLRTNLVAALKPGGRDEFLALSARVRESQLRQLETIWANLADRNGLTPPADVLTWT
jgi:hypothetical protein